MVVQIISAYYKYAGGGTRTRTPFRAVAPKATVYAVSPPRLLFYSLKYTDRIAVRTGGGCPFGRLSGRRRVTATQRR